MAQSSEQWHWARSEVAPAQNLGSYRNRVNRSHFSTLDLSLTGTRGKQGWQKKEKRKKKIWSTRVTLSPCQWPHKHALSAHPCGSLIKWTSTSESSGWRGRRNVMINAFVYLEVNILFLLNKTWTQTRVQFTRYPKQVEQSKPTTTFSGVLPSLQWPTDRSYHIIGKHKQPLGTWHFFGSFCLDGT